MPLELTARQRARLKARAHALEPIIHIGKTGVQDALVAEADGVLASHEPIKVKVNDTDRERRASIGAALADRTGSAIVQRVGKIVVLHRPKPDTDSSSR